MKQHPGKRSSFHSAVLVMILGLFSAGLSVAQPMQPAVSVNGHRMTSAEANFTSFTPIRENRNAYQRFNKESDIAHPEFGKMPYNADFPGYVEVLEKRTADERYFVNAAQPTEFKIQKGMAPLHYRKNGQWVTINSNISDKGNGIYEASEQFEPVGFDANQNLSYIKTVAGNVYFNKWVLFGMDKDGNRQKLATANWSNYTAGDNGIYVYNIFPGIDASMSVGRGAVKTNFIVKKMNFGQFDKLLFKDEFAAPFGATFKFKNELPSVTKAAGEVVLEKGGSNILELGEAITYAKNSPKENRMVSEYYLEGNNLLVAVPVDFIQQHIASGDVIIDPLVSSSGTLAQVSITGSMYNASCAFTNSCNYNLTMNTPAQATFTDVQWSFNYLATSPCWLSDGAIRIGLGACTSPSAAGFYWYCNSNTSGTCTGANISIMGELGPCLPAPSCVAQSVTFQLRFYRKCFGLTGCNNACIGAFSPWTMVIQGRTVEFTTPGNPITASSNTVCAGGSISATTAVQYGVPTRTVSWQALPGPIPGGTGNTTTINFPTAGTYSIVATATDACAQTTSAAVIVTVAPIPVANAGPTKSLTCVSNPTILNGSGGTTYTWTGPGAFNSNLQNPSVNTAGFYTLVVRNGSCTSTPATVQVVTNTTAPTVTATVASSLNCVNLTTQISLNSNVSPSSYNTTGPGVVAGGNTSLVTVNAGGVYNYSVTNPANGCVRTGSVSVTQNTSTVTVNPAVSNSLNCNVNSATITLNTNSANVTYTTAGPNVTGGSTTSVVTVGSGGTYNYTVVNTVNSCSTTGNVAVTQNTTPVTATATPASSLNCNVLTTQITINTSTTPLTYTTTGPGVVSGGNSSVVTVNTGGTYNYTVVNSFNGCFAVGTSSVTQNTSTVSVSATPSNSLNCTATNATITITSSSANVTYTTTGPGVTAGSSTSLVTVNAGGTYNYTVTNNVNGCRTSGTVAVTQNNTAPTATATPAASLNCSNLSTQITINTSTAPVTYTTSGPGVTAGSSTSLVTVNAGGTYTYVVTNPANNCVVTSTVSVTQNTTAPTPAIINNPTITCLNPTVTLNGSPGSGVTYTWSTGGGNIVSGVNNSTAAVNQPGTYMLSITSTTNGCNSSSPATVSIVSNTTAPTSTMGANQTLPCNPSSVQINAMVSPGTATVLWSGPGVCGGANSTTATACAAGVYTLTATDPSNGCSSTNQLTVNPAVGLTVSIANTGTITCAQQTVQVIVTASPAGNTYTWSGPGIIAGAGTETITVNQSGGYSVVVTNTNGCTSNNNISVVADNAPISVNASASNSVDCISTTATINTAPTPTTGSYSYTWSGPAVNGATTSAVAVSPSVNTSYTVLVMNPVNGCTATQVVNVNANTAAPSGLNINPSTFTLSCATPTTVLTASATGAVSYTWTAPVGGAIISGSNTANAGISGSGVYSVVAAGSNGCVSSVEMATISPNNDAPTYSLTNNSPSITCNGDPTVTIVITSSVPVNSYSWSPANGISGPTNTSSATFTAAGSYTAVITATNGCSSTAIVTVGLNTTTPAIVAGSETVSPITCANSTVTLAPSFAPASDLTFSWSPNPGIVGTTNTSSTQVNQAGTYTITVTNTVSGCASTATINVTGNSVPPSVTVSASSSLGISCQPGTSTITINAATDATNAAFSWTAPAGGNIISGANTGTIITSSPGVFTVDVTDAGTGCVSTATITITNNTVAPALTSSVSGNLPCNSGTTALNAASSSTDVVYEWSGSGVVSGSNTATAIVNLPGVYTVMVTDNITGCSSSNTILVTQTTASAVAASNTVSGSAPASIDFSSNGSAAASYTWNFGNGQTSNLPNPNVTFTVSGTYSVVLTVENGGCLASDTLTITVFSGLEIPEIFTPNGDNLNEIFLIKGLDAYPKAKVDIFNRWGNLVFQQNPYENKWDGVPNAAGKTGSGRLPAGTYFFILDLGDGSTPIRGYVQIQY